MKPAFLVDTNVLSELTRTAPNEGVRQWVKAAPQWQLYVSVLTLAELHRGISRLPSSARRRTLENWLTEARIGFEDRALPVDEDVAIRWAALGVTLDRVGRPVPILDGLLAATALHHNLTVVTRNTRDFEATGARIFNPWQ